MEYKDIIEEWINKASTLKDNFRLEVGNDCASKCILIEEVTFLCKIEQGATARLSTEPMEYKDIIEEWINRASTLKDNFRLEVGNDCASKCILIAKGTKRRSDLWFASTVEARLKHHYSNIKFRGTTATPVPSYVPKYAQKTGEFLKKGAQCLDYMNKFFLCKNVLSCLYKDFTGRTVSNTMNFAAEECVLKFTSAIGSNVGAAIGAGLGGPVGSVIGRVVGGVAATWIASKVFKRWF